MQEPPQTRTEKAESLSEPTAQPASEPNDAERTTTPRVAIPLLPDGTIDVEAMRSVTRERVRTLLADPNLASKLGIASPVSEKAPLKVPTQFFEKASEIILGTVDKIAVAVVVKQGYPLEQAITMMTTADDRAMLIPLATQALDDWCPAIEGKYQSLALLGAGLVSVYGSKFAALKKPASVIPFPQEAPKAPIQGEP